MDKHRAVAALKELSADLGRKPTREEFLAFSGFPKRTIDRLFGSYTKLCNASGFIIKERDANKEEKRQDRWESKYNDNTERIQENFTKELLPYANKYQKKEKNQLLIAVCNDLHSLWMDMFSFHVFTSTCRITQPDIIVLNGDILDCYALSIYSRLTSLL